MTESFLCARLTSTEYFLLKETKFSVDQIIRFHCHLTSLFLVTILTAHTHCTGLGLGLGLGPGMMGLDLYIYIILVDHP